MGELHEKDLGWAWEMQHESGAPYREGGSFTKELVQTESPELLINKGNTTY